MQEQIDYQDWSLRVSRLVELIARKTEAIKFHENSQEPDMMAIEQYNELREHYLAELSELMQGFGIIAEFRLLDRAA